jgi:hypothetical protein
MKMIKAMIYLTVALIVLFPTAVCIAEHIKQETVERMRNNTLQSSMPLGAGDGTPGDGSMDYTMGPPGQAPNSAAQFVPDQASWPEGTGQAQIGGDFQAGYAAGYQAGYANGWWEGAQAAVQMLLEYISSLQDMNMALSEFDKSGIVHPDRSAVEEGPKIKQAIDA